MTSIQQISAPFVKWQPSCSSRHKQKDEDFRELEKKVRRWQHASRAWRRHFSCRAHYSSHDSRDHPSTFKTTAFAFRWLPHHYHHLVFDDYQASLRWIKILITGASTLFYLLAPRTLCRER